MIVERWFRGLGIHIPSPEFGNERRYFDILRLDLKTEIKCSQIPPATLTTRFN